MKYVSVVACLLFVGSLQMYSQTIEENSTTNCHTGNLDEEPPALQDAIGSFLKELKTQVAADHRVQVSEMVAYPLNVWIDGSNRKVRSEEEFLSLYDRIFTEPLKQLLLRQQPDCVSRVGAQGFSFSRGEIWFDQYPDHKVRVFTITPIVMPDE